LLRFNRRSFPAYNYELDKCMASSGTDSYTCGFSACGYFSDSDKAFNPWLLVGGSEKQPDPKDLGEHRWDLNACPTLESPGVAASLAAEILRVSYQFRRSSRGLNGRLKAFATASYVMCPL
jgi:hypothetical protein